jgi:hypothetical protein
MVDFSGITLPFNVSDLIDSSMSILGILGAFVLLSLVIAFQKPIIWTIRTAIITHKNMTFTNDDPGWAKHEKWTLRDTIKMTYEKGKYRGWGNY